MCYTTKAKKHEVDLSGEGGMQMERVYQVLFIAGTTYAVVSTILGGLFDALDIDGDIDMDRDLPWLGVFRPIGIVSFITVFGGLGLFGTHMQYHPVFTLCASAIFGGIGQFSHSPVYCRPAPQGGKHQHTDQRRLGGTGGDRHFHHL